MLSKHVQCCGSRWLFIFGWCIPFMLVEKANIWIACDMFCATSICCVWLQICFQGIPKLRTHLTHIARSSLSIATFPKMHSNCIAHNVTTLHWSLHYSITTSLHYTTWLLVLSIWWEPVFSVICNVSLPFNMFSIVVCWPNLEAPTTRFSPRDWI